MKVILLKSSPWVAGFLLLAGAWQCARGGAGSGLSPWLLACLMLAAGLAALLGFLVRRLRSEDRIARLEADLCREQNARGQADRALAEADLLLARLTIRRPVRAPRQAGAPDALATQPGRIQTELAQPQQQAPLDAASAGRLERVRARLERRARLARAARPTVETG